MESAMTSDQIRRLDALAKQLAETLMTAVLCIGDNVPRERLLADAQGGPTSTA